MTKLIEKYVGTKGQIKYKGLHKVDMKTTWADIDQAQKLLNWQPQVNLEEGIKRTIEYYRNKLKQ